MNEDATGPCSVGYYCNGSAVVPTQHQVPKGHYGLLNSSHPIPCKIGTFQVKSGLGYCDDCTETSYCDETGLAENKPCPKGHYCPPKTIKPIACPEGTYNPGISKANVTDCLDCDSGYYCQGTGLDKTSGKCYAGYYCNTGSPTPTPVSSI